MDVPSRSSAHASACAWWWRGDLTGDGCAAPPRRHLGEAQPRAKCREGSTARSSAVGRIRGGPAARARSPAGWVEQGRPRPRVLARRVEQVEAGRAARRWVGGAREGRPRTLAGERVAPSPDLTGGEAPLPGSQLGDATPEQAPQGHVCTASSSRPLGGAAHGLLRGAPVEHREGSRGLRHSGSVGWEKRGASRSSESPRRCAGRQAQG
jgi:hypothetical protein